jgi:hypothetical protein
MIVQQGFSVFSNNFQGMQVMHHVVQHACQQPNCMQRRSCINTAARLTVLDLGQDCLHEQADNARGAWRQSGVDSSLRSKQQTLSSA